MSDTTPWWFVELDAINQARVRSLLDDFNACKVNLQQQWIRAERLEEENARLRNLVGAPETVTGDP